jgi:uncharacterized protein YukE
VSAAEELAGYPGGDAVAAQARKIERADGAALTQAADRLRTGAGNAATNGTEVGNAVRQLDAAWEGASADQFVAYMDSFTKAGTDIGDAMNKAAAAVHKAATAIDDAKHFVSTRCEQALGEIKSILTANAGAEQSTVDSLVRPICAEAASDIERKLTETDNALRTAASEIATAGTPASRFSAIPEPDAQPFTPAPGKLVEWTPTPPKDRATTPAATDTGSGAGASGGSPGGSGGGSAGSGGSGDGGGSGGGGGLGSSGGPPAGGPPPGNVQDWIKEAIKILQANGIPVTEANINQIWAIIQHESGGDPHAINNWDSNAAKGTPSKGLMQTIDPTFNSYKLPGHGDIWNPVDNICAGVNYAISRYGSLDNVPGIKAMAAGGDYRGY